MHISIYTRSKKNPNVLYTKSQKLFKNQDNFYCVFIYQVQRLDLSSSRVSISMHAWVLFGNFFWSNKHKQEMQGCLCVVLKIAGFKSQCKLRVFLYRKTLPLVKGWYLGFFYFLYQDKLYLRKHLLGNLALISGIAESRMAFCAPGGIFTRAFIAPQRRAFRALG